MSFPTNSSPYGTPKGFQMSPQYEPPKSTFWSSLFGKPERMYQQSFLTPGQQQNLSQLVGAGRGMGAGGAFGEAADYYRSLLGAGNQTEEALSAPELRRFREDIIPDIAEQFAGMGAGGLSSSGFRNASIRAGTDLAERLAAIRANLRQQGASGLTGIGQAGLGTYQENIFRPETYGLAGEFTSGVGQGLGKAAGTWLGGKAG